MRRDRLAAARQRKRVVIGCAVAAGAAMRELEVGARARESSVRQQRHIQRCAQLRQRQRNKRTQLTTDGAARAAASNLADKINNTNECDVNAGAAFLLLQIGRDVRHHAQGVDVGDEERCNIAQGAEYGRGCGD